MFPPWAAHCEPPILGEWKKSGTQGCTFLLIDFNQEPELKKGMIVSFTSGKQPSFSVPWGRFPAHQTFSTMDAILYSKRKLWDVKWGLKLQSYEDLSAKE